MPRCIPCANCKIEHAQALARIETLEAKLHAAEVERNAALSSLHAERERADRLEMTLSVYRENL